MEKTHVPVDPLTIMSVMGGRITTNVEMLPNALRNNRPTRAESEVAAEVIERLYAELRAARSAGYRAQDGASNDSLAKLKMGLHRAIGALSEGERHLCEILFHTLDRVVDRHFEEQRAAALASAQRSH